MRSVAVVDGRLALVGLLGGRWWLDLPAGRLLLVGRLRIVIAIAAQRAAELANALSERAAELGQAFGPEDNQCDDQHDRELGNADVGHPHNGTGPNSGWGSDELRMHVYLLMGFPAAPPKSADQ